MKASLEPGVFAVAACLLAGVDNPFIRFPAAQRSDCDDDATVVDVAASERRVTRRLRLGLFLGGSGFADRARREVSLIAR